MLGHGENSVFEAHHDLRRDYPNLAAQTVICDVRDGSRLQRIFTTLQPEIVIHAAAHKHVPLMEGNAEEAITNNAVGTRNMLQAALAAGVSRFVMISTDKAAAPQSVMGASKRLAEELVRQTAQRFGCAFMVVRFGNVLGSRGSAVSIFQQQIKRGGPITITHADMKRYFMTIAEAAHLVLEAGAIGRGGELFVLRMGDPIPVVDLARDMIRLSGADDIPIVFTGVRPGEKMTESLWEEGAMTQPTSHPDILTVHEQSMDATDWGAAIEHIALAAATGGRHDIVRELSRYLPTFSPVERRLPSASERQRRCARTQPDGRDNERRIGNDHARDHLESMQRNEAGERQQPEYVDGDDRHRDAAVRAPVDRRALVGMRPMCVVHALAAQHPADHHN